MPSNLVKKDNTYYVRIAVPRPLWETLGRREYWRTTGTGDLAKAERAKHAIIAEIKDEIDTPCNDPRDPAWLKKQAHAIRRAVQKGELDGDLASDLIGTIQDQHLKALGETRESAEGAVVRRSKVAARLATDLQYRPLSELIDDYLAEKKPDIEASTLHSKRRELMAFREWLADDPDVAEITRKITGRYVSEVIGPSDKSPSTKQGIVSTLSAFFNYCIRKGLYENANPWSGLAEDLKGSRRGIRKHTRRPWTPEEVSKIETLPHDDPMYALCGIALFTGMRLNEIAHLEESDINLQERMICLPEGKTESSVRRIPIHSKFLPLIERLHTDADGGFLIPGLKPGGLDKKRGFAVGKRIGRWIRKDVSGDKGVVFHSLRNTFMNRCENAEILESTVQLIVGHSRQSLTYGLYSPGVHFNLLQEAVEKVTFE